MKMIDTARILTKIASSFGFSTFHKIIISGKLIAVTDIISDNTVPKGDPFSIKAYTIGTIPEALLFNGTPIATTKGTAKGLSLPA
jgi:hypothetical protein